MLAFLPVSAGRSPGHEVLDGFLVLIAGRPYDVDSTATDVDLFRLPA